MVDSIPLSPEWKMLRSIVNYCFFQRIFSLGKHDVGVPYGITSNFEEVGGFQVDNVIVQYGVQN